MNHSQPWIEKYRPQRIHDIILNDTNKTIINTMIRLDKYPNMLFYGPPGTGKTTTILCLMKEYQLKHGCKKNYIHLNASHERGIDVIRSQISQFSQNNTFFEIHRKFIMLDEMDSLTKQAQNNLYHVIQKSSSKEITFILICNYLNKVIPCIRNSLLMLHFNQTSLWCDSFIYKCLENENINITSHIIENIKSNHLHDLRSIINSLQNYIPNRLLLNKRFFKDLTFSKNPKQLFKKYNQEYDGYTILCAYFKYIYENCNESLETNEVDKMKISLMHCDHVEFFIEECLPLLSIKFKKN